MNYEVALFVSIWVAIFGIMWMVTRLQRSVEVLNHAIQETLSRQRDYHYENLKWRLLGEAVDLKAGPNVKKEGPAVLEKVNKPTALSGFDKS